MFLVVLDRAAQRMTYADIIDSPNPVRYTVPTGTTRPLYVSAGGQMLLAYQDPGWADSYIRITRLEKLTERTITDPEALRERLADDPARRVRDQHRRDRAGRRRRRGADLQRRWQRQRRPVDRRADRPVRAGDARAEAAAARGHRARVGPAAGAGRGRRARMRRGIDAGGQGGQMFRTAFTYPLGWRSRQQ